MNKLLQILAFSSLAMCLSGAALADSVMDRVNKTQTIRCGYVSYSPASFTDLKTGEMKGYTVDIMEEAGRRMGLKIEWTYETNWPTMSTDLQTNKFDLACVTYWGNPRASRHMLSSIPVFYQPVFFITRADDTRFDDDVSKVNDDSVTVSVLEGDVPETILNQLYPNTRQIALPQSSSFSQVFQEVASGRTDVTIASSPDMGEFADNNPGVLKVIRDQPVRLYASVLQMLPEAQQLKSVLDMTIREMQLDGTIEKIVKEYAQSEDDHYFIEYPYKKIRMSE